MKQTAEESQKSNTVFTVHQQSVAEVVVKRSRFIAFLCPAGTKDEAMNVLGVAKKQHYDAVHHCYAYRLGADGLEYKMSDDGEPSGTAGKPILFALQKASITNAILVVVRYFGGTKLGVGPLARAYMEAAALVIREATLVPLVPMVTLDVFCMYDDVSRVIGVLDEVGATYEQTFADAVTFTVQVAEAEAEFLTQEIVERTNARAGFSNLKRI